MALPALPETMAALGVRLMGRRAAVEARPVFPTTRHF
jgi:hypothetical protein